MLVACHDIIHMIISLFSKLLRKPLCTQNLISNEYKGKDITHLYKPLRTCGIMLQCEAI